jgi:class 3 adenylate cyclase
VPPRLDVPQGERKQVTVLFADVVGSMDLAAGMDPEEWGELMERFFAILREGINRFDGRIDKFTGDGVMALFGAPVAYEDHAQRACAAALHLRDELARYRAELEREPGIRFDVRMGLNSGEVVARSVGQDLKVEYTAVGNTVGLAQRMEALAEPGTVYLTAATAGLVRGYFELRELGPMPVKGAADGMAVFELVGRGAARTPLEVAAPLAGPGQRSLPGEPRRCRPRVARAGGDHVPPRVPRHLGPPVALRPAAATAAPGRGP